MPAPKEIDPDFDEATTRLEIWTRILDPVTPRAVLERQFRRRDGTTDTDHSVEFGTMQMGLGRAFSFTAEDGLPEPSAGVDESFVIAKTIEVVQGTQPHHRIDSLSRYQTVR